MKKNSCPFIVLESIEVCYYLDSSEESDESDEYMDSDSDDAGFSEVGFMSGETSTEEQDSESDMEGEDDLIADPDDNEDVVMRDAAAINAENNEIHDEDNKADEEENGVAELNSNAADISADDANVLPKSSGEEPNIVSVNEIGCDVDSVDLAKYFPDNDSDNELDSDNDTVDLSKDSLADMDNNDIVVVEGEIAEEPNEMDDKANGFAEQNYTITGINVDINVVQETSDGEPDSDWETECDIGDIEGGIIVDLGNKDIVEVEVSVDVEINYTGVENNENDKKENGIAVQMCDNPDIAVDDKLDVVQNKVVADAELNVHNDANSKQVCRVLPCPIPDDMGNENRESMETEEDVHEVIIPIIIRRGSSVDAVVNGAEYEIEVVDLVSDSEDP